MPVPDTVRDRVPDVTGNRALWWGGLAVLAATEVITWPIAGVVAAGTYVAERRAKAAADGRATGEKDDPQAGSQDQTSGPG